MAALASASTSHSLFSGKLVILSSARPTPPPPSPPETTNHPSLSDQLRPLSHTLLQDNHPQSHVAQQPKPKPIWVNPARSRPPILSPLRRQPRRSPASSTDAAAVSPSLPRLARSLATLTSSDISSTISPSAAAALSAADALSLLNSLVRRPSLLLSLLSLLESHSSFPLETIYYNIALKSFRISRNYDAAAGLMHKILAAGKPPPDNITYSTLITCAKRCHRYDEALSWFDHMYKSGLAPDEVTYSAVLDVYARLNRREDVLVLYDRARADGWQPDNVALSVLARMFGRAGDYEGIQYVLAEMRSISMLPNLTVYNALLEALGNAGKPGLARNLFNELVDSGVAPDAKTLTAVTKIYGKARWGRDALQLWERMRENNWPADFFLYNTLLSMCADLGWEREAEELFDDMKKAERYARPDSFSYTAMINIYASAGKAERAKEMFDEMLDKGVQPNVMGCTCLIQCLGKARRIEDAVMAFETSLQRGVEPDDRLATCLLSLVSLCREEELKTVFTCLEKAKPQLVRFVKMIGDENSSYDLVQEEFKSIMNITDVEARRPFCNCFIDICRNRSFPLKRAQELLHLGSKYGLYASMHTKSSEEWSLDLRSLSVGAANTAFEEWMKTLSDFCEQQDPLPQMFSVYTGTGSHKFSQGLAGAFASHLEKLAAPFSQNEEKSGCFVAAKEDLIPWLESRAVTV